MTTSRMQADRRPEASDGASAHSEITTSPARETSRLALRQLGRKELSDASEGSEMQAAPDVESQEYHSDVGARSIRFLLHFLWRTLSPARRRQVVMSTVLLGVSAGSEMVSLGAALPFLAVLAQPETVLNTPLGRWLAGVLSIDSPMQALAPACIAFAGAAITAGLLRIVVLRLAVRLSHDIGAEISTRVLTNILGQPYVRHLNQNSSDLISLMMHEVWEVTFIVQGLIQAVSSGFISLSIFVVLLFVEPWATVAVAIVLGAGYLVVSARSRRMLNMISSRQVASRSASVRTLQEAIGGIREVIMNGHQRTVVDGYFTIDSRLRADVSYAAVIAVTPRYVFEAFGLTVIAAAAWWIGRGDGGKEVLGAIPFLGALALGAQRALPLLQQMFSVWSGLKQKHATLHRVVEYLELPAAGGQSSDVLPLELTKEVELQGIGFRYAESRPWVFRDVSLSMTAGDCVGLVGVSGSGKSTFLDVFMGLLSPQEGKVIVDGVDLEGDSVERWRRSISHVPQEVFLVDGTIRKNIALGTPESLVDDVRMQKVVEVAQLGDLISSLPAGLNTLVGERGTKLSGGQRQRIGIARALYHPCSVLVLDEATSALDEKTEAAVVKSVHLAMPGVTKVIVSHRKSSLSNCSKIFSLDSK